MYRVSQKKWVTLLDSVLFKIVQIEGIYDPVFGTIVPKGDWREFVEKLKRIELKLGVSFNIYATIRILNEKRDGWESAEYVMFPWVRSYRGWVAKVNLVIMFYGC